MKLSIFRLTPLTAALTFATSAVMADEAFDPAKPVALPRAGLSYFNLNPMIQMADAYGNLTNTAHGTFGKFPAHFDAGRHTHTGAYHGVVIKGTMTNQFAAGTNPPELVAGSYWYVPAMLEHSTACISDEPCEFFFFAGGKFDFMPASQ